MEILCDSPNETRVSVLFTVTKTLWQKVLHVSERPVKGKKSVCFLPKFPDPLNSDGAETPGPRQAVMLPLGLGRHPESF